MTRAPALALLLLFTSSAAAAQESGWTYRSTPEPVELAHTSPGSPIPDLALTCVKDSRQIVARFPVAQRLAADNSSGRWLDDVGRPAPWPVSVTIASGETQTTIPGEANLDPIGDGSIITVEFADRAPVAEAFSRTGMLAVSALGGSVQPAAAARRSVQGFLRYCR
ncbi:MAG: hypothetical protein Q8R71_13145 [Phenylobacterium sp.]|nr:hypothetical protein [Phenylobacterium sp.]